MAPLLYPEILFTSILTHSFLACSMRSSSHMRPSRVTRPQRARIRRSPSGPCTIVSGLRLRLVTLCLPCICCGLAPDRSAALTRFKSQSMVPTNAFTILITCVCLPVCRALPGSSVVKAPQRRQLRPLLLSPGCARALLGFPARSQQGVEPCVALLPCLLPGRRRWCRGRGGRVDGDDATPLHPEDSGEHAQKRP